MAHITCTPIPCTQHTACWNIQHSDGRLLTYREVTPSHYHVAKTGRYRLRKRTISLSDSIYHTRGKLTAKRKAIDAERRLNAKDASK